MFEHQDWYWASLENDLRRCNKATTRIDRFEPVYGLGVVRRMWQGVDGLQPESDGEWGYGLCPYISYSFEEPVQLVVDDQEEIIRGKRKPRRPREEASVRDWCLDMCKLYQNFILDPSKDPRLSIYYE